MNYSERGVEIINKVFTHFSATYPPRQMIMLESSGPVEALAMSIIVRHIRELMKTAVILWGVSDDVFKQWNVYADKYECVCFPFPAGASMADRHVWLAHAKTLGLADVQFPGLGYKMPNCHQVDNFILNAGIKKLLIPKIPILPHNTEDYAWHDNLMVSNGYAGKPYLVVEYDPTLGDHMTIFNRKLQRNTLWIGKQDSTELKLDIRAESMRHIKVAMERAKVVVISTDLNNLISCCDGLKTKIIDARTLDPFGVICKINEIMK